MTQQYANILKLLQCFKLGKGSVNYIGSSAERVIQSMSDELPISDGNRHRLASSVSAHLVLAVCFNTDALRPIRERSDVGYFRISNGVRIRKPITCIADDLRFYRRAYGNRCGNSPTVILCRLGITPKQCGSQNQHGKSFHYESLILRAECQQLDITLSLLRNQDRKHSL